MNQLQFFKVFLILTIIDIVISKEIDVILSLQDYFSSKLLLVLTKPGDNFSADVAYDLTKRQRGKFYTGQVTNEGISYKMESYSRFYGTLLISFFDARLLINIVQNFKTYSLGSLHWVHFVKNDRAMKDLEKMYIPYNCQFIVIKRIGDNYELFEMYKLNEKNNSILVKFGNYSDGSYPVLNFYKRRINLNKFDFAMTSSGYSLPEYPKNEIVWDYLQQKMNFTYTLINSKPLTGSVYPNGTTTGLFTLLENDTADVCIGNFVVTSERIQIFDFIYPIHLMDVKVYISITNNFKWTSYIAPFSRHLWLIIFLWACLASVCLFTINSSFRFFFNEKPHGSVFIILKALCYQSQGIQNSKLSYLICLLMPYLITVVINQAYSGCLFSYLAVPDYTPPFQSLEEILNDGSYKILIPRDGFIWTYFQTDASAQSQLMRDKFILPFDLQAPGPHAGFHRLCESEKLAFIHVSPANVSEKCRIVEINNPIFRRPMGIILRNHFPFLAVMNHQLIRIQESGLLSRTLINNHILEMTDDNSDPQDFSALSFESILPLFFLLISGLALAFVVFLIEILIRQHKRKYINIIDYYYWRKQRQKQSPTPTLKKFLYWLLHRRNWLATWSLKHFFTNKY